MKLRYTPQARQDLREIKSYISADLGNPKAAERITAGILDCCSHLKDYPNMGASLAEKTGRETDLRYLVCGNTIAFYRAEQDCISVFRILSGRTDYMRLIFGTEEAE